MYPAQRLISWPFMGFKSSEPTLKNTLISTARLSLFLLFLRSGKNKIKKQKPTRNSPVRADLHVWDSLGHLTGSPNTKQS